MSRSLVFVAGLALLQGACAEAEALLGAVHADDECTGGGGEGACAVSALQLRASARPAGSATSPAAEEKEVAPSLAQDAGAEGWGYGGYGRHGYGGWGGGWHRHSYGHHGYGYHRHGYGGWLQTESSGESTECTDCSCCQDGCLDEAGKCQKDDGDLGACFKGVETGRAFTICEKDAPVKLKATLTAPAPDTCSACTGGCATPTGCHKVEGQVATLMDCIIEALDVEGVSFCGDSPQSIAIDEEGAAPSLAQEGWGYGYGGYGRRGYGYGGGWGRRYGYGHHGYGGYHRHGYGGWLQTEASGEGGEEKPSLAQDAGKGHGHGHHHHHHHHHGHGRYGHGGWVQTEPAAESVEESPSLAQDAGAEGWGYGYGGYGRRGYGYGGWGRRYRRRYGYYGWR